MDESSQLKWLEDDGSIQWYVSGDGLLAELVVKKPVEGNLEHLQGLRACLVERGIVFGLVDETLEQWPQLLKTAGRYPVARGMKPARGEDGYVKVLFQKNLIKEFVEDQSGRVDYFNFIKVPEVRSGDILAELVPAGQGTAGIDVLGQEMVSRPGREARLVKGKNVEITEDGSRAIATAAGKPAMVGKTISVFQVFEVQGDVDLSTGNINFIGSVEVRGTVRSGLSIKSGGDIEVWEDVESADLEAAGNIVIRGGIFAGKKGQVRAQGDIQVRIVENGYVEAMNNVFIGETVMHSSILAGRSVVMQAGKGLIIGGSVRAGEMVWAKTVGSPMGTRTDIVVGISPAVREEYARLKKESEEAKKAIEAAEKAFTAALRRKQAGLALSNQLNQVLLKFKESFESAQEKEQICEQRISELEELFRQFEGKFLVEDRVYPQVRIVLGHISYITQDEIPYATFSEKDGDIVISSFDRPRVK